MNSPIHNRHPACPSRRRKAREEKFEARLKMIERAEIPLKERTVIDGGCVLYRPSQWALKPPKSSSHGERTTQDTSLTGRARRRRD
jgi:hypothetical protein